MTLFYEEYGDRNGDLMLFLHGGGVSGWMWEKQVQYFTSFHCIVPDLPHHGKSKQHQQFTIENSAEQLNSLIHHKAMGRRVIVIGFSLGAQVLIQMLSLQPNLVDVAVINSALVLPMPAMKRWIAPSVKLTFPLISNRLFSKLQAKTLYIDEQYFEKYYEESSQMRLESLIHILEENMSFSIPAAFAEAKGKILVTVGEKEKSIMRKSTKALVQSHANCTEYIIPGIGHGFSLAKPDEFNQMVEEWMTKGRIG